MLRIFIQLVGVITLAPVLIGTFAEAADPEPSHSFRITIDSHLEMELQGNKHKIEADTVFTYTWKRKDGERILSFDSMWVKASQDRKPLMDTFLSREKLVNTEEGKTDEVPIEKASAELKKVLQDSYGAPVCKVYVDEDGKEIKRQVIAGPGAKDLIAQGVIANALLFHAPFMRTTEEWSAPAEVSMGNGGFAKGKLTYRKTPGGKSGQAVKVSGTLSNEGFRQPGTPQSITKVKYAIRGEQTYDPTQQEWVSGKLSIDVSFQLAADDTVIGAATGTMVMSFEELPGNK
jgi:hypothetical protein